MNKLALHSNFETLIENFATNQIGICDHFLSEELAAKLKIDLISLFQDDQFNSAGTGNHEEKIKYIGLTEIIIIPFKIAFSIC